MDAKPLPPQSELLRLFAYDPDTGALVWRVQPPGYRRTNVIGTQAGTRKPKGKYLSVGWQRQYYLAHRIIWKMVTGEEPPGIIDHRDSDTANNRWANFRPVTNGQNLWNSKLRKDNKSGFKGVFFRPKQPRRPWRATLALGNRKYLQLGSYATPEEAAGVWERAASEQRGEFLRVR